MCVSNDDKQIKGFARTMKIKIERKKGENKME